jgi:hypothetical protein
MSYSPTLGRFLERDPIGYDDGMNPYQFVHSNPVRFLDPSGCGTYQEGPATRPDIQWDNGFKYDPKASPTAGDWASWYKYGSLLYGSEALSHLPDGTRAYEHYRDGTGTDLAVDYEKAFRDDTSIHDGVQAEILSAQAEAERLRGELGKDCFSMTGSAVLVNSATENWQKALGGHDIWGAGSVTFDPSTSTYTMKLTLTMEDFYNFNKGQADIATGLPDTENGRFEVFGWAKSFYSRGKIERTITWQEGNIGAAPPGSGGGRR